MQETLYNTRALNIMQDKTKQYNVSPDKAIQYITHANTNEYDIGQDKYEDARQAKTRHNNKMQYTTRLY